MVVRVTRNLLWQDWLNSQICWDMVLAHLSLFIFFPPFSSFFPPLFLFLFFVVVPLEVDRLGCFLWFVFSCRTARQNYQVADWNPLAFFFSGCDCECWSSRYTHGGTTEWCVDKDTVKMLVVLFLVLPNYFLTFWYLVRTEVQDLLVCFCSSKGALMRMFGLGTLFLFVFWNRHERMNLW